MDDRVASAIAHWAPRFTANGVQPADFARVTASVEAWPDWCAASAYFHFAKFVFVEDVEQMRAAHVRAVAWYTDALPHLDPPGRRVTMPFEDGALGASSARRTARGRSRWS